MMGRRWLRTKTAKKLSFRTLPLVEEEGSVGMGGGGA